MKYCIIHVNDRAKYEMDHNKNILKNFKYVDDIEFFDGNIGNAWDVLNHKGINQNVWNPYDGRNMPPLPGELGIWVSTINIFEYIVKNKIKQMLVLEDDIILQEDFIDKFNEIMKELPEDFDFLSLYYFNEHNQITDQTEIGLNNIHRSYTQFSAAQATLYSYFGAKKILKCIYRKGIEYTSDCFIFRQSLENLVNGYSIKKPNDFFLIHNYKKIKSLIDPNDKRNVGVL